MSTDSATVEFLLDQLGRRGASFTTKRMFGEYCVYRDGMPVAFVCDDVLFVKDTPAGRDAIGLMTVIEFAPPYPEAKPYLRLAPDTWDDGDWLRHVLDVTAAALPAPKPKKPKNSASAGAAAPRADAVQASKSAAKREKTPQPADAATPGAKARKPKA